MHSPRTAPAIEDGPGAERPPSGIGDTPGAERPATPIDDTPDATSAKEANRRAGSAIVVTNWWHSKSQRGAQSSNSFEDLSSIHQNPLLNGKRDVPPIENERRWEEQSATTVGSFAKTKWWESEAQKEVQSTSSPADLLLIHQFVPFGDTKTFSLALSRQKRPQLNALWIQICDKDIICQDRSLEEMAEDIVDSFEQSPTMLNIEKWCPPTEDSLSKTEAVEVASSLDRYFCDAFLKISQKDWVRAALGYPTPSIARLLERSLDVRLILQTWFQKQERADSKTSVQQYVVKELSGLNPLANWVASNTSTRPEETLRSSFHSFQTLSAQKRDDFMCWVKEIAVAAQLLYHNIGGMDVDWNKDYSSGSTLLHQINNKDPKSLAIEMKRHDAIAFSTHSDVGAIWQTLYDITLACVTVDRDMGERIGKVAKELFSIKDYHSAIAMLVGLNHAKVHTTETWPLSPLIQSDGNWANYRAQWERDPRGVPFRAPYSSKERRREELLRGLHGIAESKKPAEPRKGETSWHTAIISSVVPYLSCFGMS